MVIIALPLDVFACDDLETAVTAAQQALTEAEKEYKKAVKAASSLILTTGQTNQEDVVRRNPPNNDPNSNAGGPTRQNPPQTNFETITPTSSKTVQNTSKRN